MIVGNSEAELPAPINTLFEFQFIVAAETVIVRLALAAVPTAPKAEAMPFDCVVVVTVPLAAVKLPVKLLSFEIVTVPPLLPRPASKLPEPLMTPVTVRFSLSVVFWVPLK